MAFKDMWNWEEDGAKEAFAAVLSSNSTVTPMVRAFHTFLGGSPMMAYIAMMSARLIEMRRILRPSGSLYLHCDPYASHYLKIILDGIFDNEDGFVSEIIWRRTNARGTKGRWPRLHDTILHYSKGKPRFNPLKIKADKAKLPHTLVTGPDGLKYQTYELTAQGATKEGESGRPWRGFDPSDYGRHWGNGHAQMEAWDAFRLIHWPKDGGFPRRLDDKPFDPEDRMVTVGDVWTDIDRLNQTAKERLGYPTQKPLALLKRVLEASSNPGELILDPFCGCGTAVEAAEHLGRQWIGIDVSHYAIDVIEGRLRDYCKSAKYSVSGRPEELRAAHDLAQRDKYEFQWWVL
jgi:DNA modification methylase